MPQQDTISSIIDTVVNLQKDTIINPDSVTLSDTIMTGNVPNITFNGFEGISHPSLPANENWVFITLLVLLSLSVISVLRSSGWLTNSMKDFFKVKERVSIFNKSTVSDFQSRSLLILFSIGIFSLYSFLMLHSDISNFQFDIFLRILGVTAGFFLIKFITIKIIGYVFIHPSKQKLGLESYFNVLTYLSFALFPLLVIQIYSPENLRYYISLFGVFLCILASLVYIIKLFLIFFDNFVATFYILLYLCTLEILPVVLLIYSYKFIM